MKKRIPVIASILIVMTLLIAMATPVYAWGLAKSDSYAHSGIGGYASTWVDANGDGAEWWWKLCCEPERRCK